ncbi:ABC transporter substrate-binding protein [Neobacillus mesonae]|uniref:ABC transporter substrate-binding protein n=1 Tax=Neobacillus mesonae TaxID=1193713 RepID=UPI002041968C|nr:ABC transporter substrate-binding protein [Neobacillus mesonae]MCM3568238.1 ABC transporter substrate-binding protein [Neobacillus mesonae]
MKKRNSLVRLLGLIFTILIVLTATACSGQKAGTGGKAGESTSNSISNSSSGDKDTIKIGLITPMTGGSASHGADTVDTAKLIAKQINDAGGILDGRKIEFVIEDDKSLPEQGVTAFKKLYSQGIKFFTGTMNSSVAIPITNVAKDSDAIYLISGAQAPQPLEMQTKGNIFGIHHTNIMFGQKFHKWIMDNLNLKTVVVVAENTDFGKNEIAALKANWKGENAPKIIAIEHFERSQTDFSVLLTKVRSLKPDAIYLAAAGTSLTASFFKQVEQLGITSQKLMNPGNMAQDFVKEGGSAVEGVISADIYHPSLDNKVNKQFVKDFKEMYNKLPTPINVTTWESLKLLLNSIEKAGTADDIAAISKVLKETTWETPRGTLTFDEKGRAHTDSLILEVKNGEIVPVK